MRQTLKENDELKKESPLLRKEEFPFYELETYTLHSISYFVS
jgi:hypothetical protein